MKFFLIVLLILTILLLCSCLLRPKYYLEGSRGFNKKEVAFNVKLKKAKDIFYKSGEGPKGMFRLGGIYIIGNEYFFCTKFDKRRIYLEGYYINGITGEMSFKESNEILK